MTVLIRGARLLGERPGRPAASTDGVIAEVGTGLGRRATPRCIDADGLVALPGLVDLHTHLREPGREDAETVATGTRGRRARRLHRRATRWPTPSPVADTAGVVEQVWRARPRGRATATCCRSAPSPWASRASELAELGAMAGSRARVRVFSDDGQLRPRRAADAPGAGVRQGVRRRRRPARAGPAPHRAARVLHEGELSGRLGLPGWPGDRRGGRSSPATCMLAAAHRLAAARLPRLHRRLASRSSAGPRRRASTSPPRSRPHHLLLTTDLLAGYDPRLQGQPAAAPGRGRRGAARRPWPTAPSTPSPPTTPRTPARTRSARSSTRPSACSASRPRCRSSATHGATRACSTGPTSPA